MAIPKEFIEDLKFRNQITDVIGGYVEVKRIGKHQKCKCPFHNETDASLVIYPENQSFYCFGCGAAGDVISFVMKIENLDYISTIKNLADRAGMEIPQQSKQDEKLEQERQMVLMLNKKAARFYYDMLVSEHGKKARDYLRERKLTGATVKKFGIGYAPEAWRALTDFLQKEGHSEADLVKAGLSVRGTKGRVYDRFRARLMIPIINIRGEIIGFGGRIIEGEGPKYLNSSETILYKKSRNLFAINFAKMASEKSFLLCEGYLDVIALHQAGFTNAVATLGTALTKEQAYLITSYREEVLLCYDSDAAGQAAARKAALIFDGLPVRTKMILMEGAKDPDEFLKKFGAERFARLILESKSAIDTLLLIKKKHYNLAKAEDKLLYLNEAADLLSQMTDRAAAEIYAGKIAEELSIDRELVVARMNTPKEQRQSLKKAPEDNEKKAQKIPNNLIQAEDNLISLLYKHQDQMKHILETLSSTRMATIEAKEILEMFESRFASGASVTLDSAREALSETAFSRLVYSINTAGHVILTSEELLGYKRVFEKYQTRKTLQKDVREMQDEEMEALIAQMRKNKAKGEF